MKLSRMLCGGTQQNIHLLYPWGIWTLLYVMYFHHFRGQNDLQLCGQMEFYVHCISYNIFDYTNNMYLCIILL